MLGHVGALPRPQRRYEEARGLLHAVEAWDHTGEVADIARRLLLELAGD